MGHRATFNYFHWCDSYLRSIITCSPNLGEKFEITSNGPLNMANLESQTVWIVARNDASREKLRYSHSPSSWSFKESIFKGDYSISWKTLTEIAWEGKFFGGSLCQNAERCGSQTFVCEQCAFPAAVLASRSGLNPTALGKDGAGHTMHSLHLPPASPLSPSVWVPIAIVVGITLVNLEVRSYVREKEQLKSKSDSLSS